MADEYQTSKIKCMMSGVVVKLNDCKVNACHGVCRVVSFPGNGPVSCVVLVMPRLFQTALY